MPASPCILALDASLGRRSVAVVAGGVALGAAIESGDRGERLAPMVAAALRSAGLPASALDAVAVTVGPGSFTGIRAALALAHGLALGGGQALVAVTVAEALAAGLPPLHGRTLWVAIDSRRGRVFLDIAGQLAAVALDGLPEPGGPVAVAGDAALAVTARLAARGCDVLLTDARGVGARDVARVAAARLAGALPALACLPLYVDAPEARLPAPGSRPAPGSGLIVATPAHAGAMAAIHAAAFPVAERWDGAAFAAQLAMPGHFGLVDPNGGLILVRVAMDEAEVLTFGVAPGARRQGIGRRLLGAAVAAATARGAGAMFLEVAESNIAAASLYATSGFAQVGLRPSYYPSGQDGLVLRLALPFLP